MDEGPTAHFRLNFCFRRMRGPLHTRYTSYARRDEGPDADWLDLILKMDEGLVVH